MPPRENTSPHPRFGPLFLLSIHTMNPSKATRTLFIAALAVALAACGGSSPDSIISGTLAGLGAGLSVTVKKNTTETLALTSNGPFSFATPIAAGNGYAVTVLTQPVGQLCSVTGGTGTVSTSGVATPAAAVTCVFTASLGVTVTGLATGASVALSNAGVPLSVTTNGSFAFAGILAAGSAYAINVDTQPTGQTCTVVNATGAAVANAVTLVAVNCV